MSFAALPPLPLVGRESELQVLHSALDAAGAGSGHTLFFTGPSGAGKTRLTAVAIEEAARRGWQVAAGRAYSVETGMPYALLSDAMMGLLEEMTPESLDVLSRGATAELGQIFPALGLPTLPLPPPRGHGPEEKTRLLWNFSRLLARMAARDPLLLILEDLHWADAASLELIHFVARDIAADRIAIIGTVNDVHRSGNAELRSVERSLTSLGLLAVRPLAPLTHADTSTLICRTFQVEGEVADDFIAHIFNWTRGNPFFLEETLKSLVESGRLYLRDGVWLGWATHELRLPRSVRELILQRIEQLSPEARELAEVHAVLGTDAPWKVLRALSEVPDAKLVEPLRELCHTQILEEREEGSTVVYDFRHPLMRETVASGIGAARTQLLHGFIARTLELEYGDRASEHVEELAFHFARADARKGSSKAVTYLVQAGKAALRQFAYREAVDCLSAALERSEEDGVSGAQIIEDLARALQRMGEYGKAVELWKRALDTAGAAGDMDTVARCEHRLGLAARWSGRYPSALVHFAAGLKAAGEATTRIRILLSLGECLQELGRGEEARREIEEALEIARAEGEDRLVARAHFALVLLHTWMGPPSLAREHGAAGLVLAERAGDRSLCCTLYYGLAVLEGLTGEGEAVVRHIKSCEQLATELGSPLHRLFIAEVELEVIAGMGKWKEAIALGERSIAVARVFRQHTLLPRLLVWTALIYCGRGDLDRAREYIDEAWESSGAGRADPAGGEPFDVHTVLPAHSGKAGFHLARQEYDEVIRIGNAGLALADQSGYSPWAIHRLLPIMLEAAMLARDMESARKIRDRLRSDSERQGHKLGLAWADSCDALLVFLDGDIDRSLSLLRQGAEQLEAIPFVCDGARLRRQLAARLRDTGHRDEALVELRRIHDIFHRLGAREELARTREQIRELGGRPLARESGVGVDGLTGRETEIIRLVMAGKSNKAIGRTLGISGRTVSTHLTNVFRKLEVGSRGELADRARLLQLPAG